MGPWISQVFHGQVLQACSRNCNRTCCAGPLTLNACFCVSDACQPLPNAQTSIDTMMQACNTCSWNTPCFYLTTPQNRICHTNAHTCVPLAPCNLSLPLHTQAFCTNHHLRLYPSLRSFVASALCSGTSPFRSSSRRLLFL